MHLFSCFAAARAACVSTWLGELPRVERAAHEAAAPAKLLPHRGIFDENLFKFENGPQRKAKIIYFKALGQLARRCLACRAQRGSLGVLPKTKTHPRADA